MDQQDAPHHELAGAALTLTVLLLVAALGVSSAVHAPSAGECVDAWNEPSNESTRESIAGTPHLGASVEGWLAKETYAYCHVTLAGLTRWTLYVSLLSANLDGAPGFVPEGHGTVRGDPQVGVERWLNAEVGRDGTLRLRG